MARGDHPGCGGPRRCDATQRKPRPRSRYLDAARIKPRLQRFLVAPACINKKGEINGCCAPQSHDGVGNRSALNGRGGSFSIYGTAAPRWIRELSSRIRIQQRTEFLFATFGVGFFRASHSAESVFGHSAIASAASPCWVITMMLVGRRHFS